jgi:hypothetical protein
MRSGQYPIFNKYPTFVVDFQLQERERIRQEEMDFLRQRVIALELEQQTEKLRIEVWHGEHPSAQIVIVPGASVASTARAVT